MSEIKHCQCAACRYGVIHASDCAVHNAPAFPIGKCDCGVVQATRGPWKIVEREVLEDGSVYPRHIVGGATELQVCLLESPCTAQIAIEQPESIWATNAVGERNGMQISAAPDMAMVLELLAAEADAGMVMIPSGLRLTIDAALIKAGRKAAPVRNGD